MLPADPAEALGEGGGGSMRSGCRLPATEHSVPGSEHSVPGSEQYAALPSSRRAVPIVRSRSLPLSLCVGDIACGGLGFIRGKKLLQNVARNARR